MSFYIRPAVQTDLKKTYSWLCEGLEETGSPSLDVYGKQFEAQILQKNSSLYIVMNFLKPVGQISLEREDDRSVVVCRVDESYQGEGIEKKMLLLLEQEFRKKIRNNEESSTVFVMEIEGENQNLRKQLISIGYTEEKQENRLLYTKEINVKEKQKHGFPLGLRNREASFEILRVFAMLMVLVLHYLDKGGLLKSTGEPLTIKEHIPWVLESFCRCAVNIYVLIGSYFLVNKKFHLSRVMKIWAEVFFYSVVITIVCLLTGVTPKEEVLYPYNICFFMLPGLFGHYWFATAYILLLFFSPVLNKAIYALSRKQLGNLILLLVGVFSVVPSVSPFQLTVDDAGVSVLWFLVLYLIAGYIKCYGIPWMERWCILIFVGSVLATYCANYIAGGIAFRNPGMPYIKNVPRHSNFIFLLLMSVALFCFVKNRKVACKGIAKLFVWIAPYTFGVYLIHEHLLLRYKWMFWLKLGEDGRSPLALHMVASILGMFFVCICIGILRSFLFALVDRLMQIALKLYFRAKEAFDYLIAGALTTLINWLAYAGSAYILFKKLFPEEVTRVLVSNILAWIVAVLFAYIINRSFVFHSEAKGAKAVWKEFAVFVSARVFSFLVETGLMFVMVKMAHINDLLSKLLISIIVIVMNYFFSKLVIFKKKVSGNKASK